MVKWLLIPAARKWLATRAELRKEELEDKGEADHQGWPTTQARSYLSRLVSNINQVHGEAVPLQHGRQIPHPEIALVLITDQDHIHRI